MALYKHNQFVHMQDKDNHLSMKLIDKISCDETSSKTQILVMTVAKSAWLIKRHTQRHVLDISVHTTGINVLLKGSQLFWEGFSKDFGTCQEIWSFTAAGTLSSWPLMLGDLTLLSLVLLVIDGEGGGGGSVCAAHSASATQTKERNLFL